MLVEGDEWRGSRDRAVVPSAAELAAGTRLLARRTDGRQPAFARPSRTLLLPGLLAFCAFALDGAAYNWSAVDLRTEHGASPELAAWAFTAFAVALAVGRTTGDRHVARFGRMRVVHGCAGAAASGAAPVVLAPAATLALAGWALVVISAILGMLARPALRRLGSA